MKQLWQRIDNLMFRDSDNAFVVSLQIWCKIIYVVLVAILSPVLIIIKHWQRIKCLIRGHDWFTTGITHWMGKRTHTQKCQRCGKIETSAMNYMHLTPWNKP